MTCSYDDFEDNITYDNDDNEWLSVPFHLRKFQHLWNLLNRSIIYASTLLSVIETKQHKRNKRRKLQKKQLKKQREKKTFFGQDDYQLVVLVVDDLIDKVVLKIENLPTNTFQCDSTTFQSAFSDDFDALHVKSFDSQSQYVQDLLEPANTSSSCVADSFVNDASNRDYDFVGSNLQESRLSENSFSRDSGLGNSYIKTESWCLSSPEETSFSKLEIENTFSKHVFCPDSQPENLLPCSNVIGDLCYEEDYMKSLQRRRGMCSSPKSDIKHELLVKHENLDQSLLKSTTTNNAAIVENCCLSIKNSHSPNPSNQLSQLVNPPALKSSSNSCTELKEVHSKASPIALHSTEVVKFVKSDNSVDFNFGLQCFSSMKKDLVKEQECPICNKFMAAKTINKHLDICTGVAVKRECLRNSSSENPPPFPRRQLQPSKKRFPSAFVTPASSQSHGHTKNTRRHEKLIPSDVSSDDDSGESNLPTGMETLKMALKETIAGNQAVTDLVVQAAVAASLQEEAKKVEKERQAEEISKLDKLKKANGIKKDKKVKKFKLRRAEKIEKTKKTPSETVSITPQACKIETQEEKSVFCKVEVEEKHLPSKMEKKVDEKVEVKTVATDNTMGLGSKKNSFSPSFKVKFRIFRRCAKEISSESEEEDANAEVEVPSAPTRRSSRSIRKKSYCEVSSDSEDGVKVEAIKKKCLIQKAKAKGDDSDGEYTIPEDECRTSAIETTKINIKEVKKTEATDSESEDGEIGPRDIDVEELLSRKFYKPDITSVVNLVTEQNGVRHFKGEPVDPAQPRYFTGGLLREYQITGYQWLKLLFENGESGILADEMGLGKTIQSIALICKLVQSGVKGPFLVCAPTSTLSNWFSEMQHFTPKISLLLYHGTAPERVHLLQCFLHHVKIGHPVVMITSYDILLRDKVALSNCCWNYLILDEGHRLKNLKGKTFQELKTFTTCAKLMLTGTPLQNNLSELWSLLNFLLPEVFDDFRAFESWFDVDSIQTNERILSILHQVLTPFLLRRVKADVEVKIPRKREILVKAPFSSLQDKYYRATVDRSIVQLVTNKEYYSVTLGVANPDTFASNSQENEGENKKLTRNKQSVYLKEKYDVNLDDFVINVTLNNMMMQLRKCCNHPYLIQYPLIRGSDNLRIDDDIVTTCGKMMLLDRMLPTLKQQGHKILLFSQMSAMLDILEDYCKLREYSIVRLDGSTKCEERFNRIKQFNEDPTVFIFLLSTRAGGLGINLTGADTVIIYDSDWNPQNDLQAQDRCHRIGQIKPVVVFRLVTMGTIDQQIVERAAMKRKLEKMIIHKEKFKGNLETELRNCQIISQSELLTLLESNVDVNVVESKENVISEHDLHRLLDRSDLYSQDQNADDVERMEWTPSRDITVTDGVATNAPFQVLEETTKENILL